MLKILMILTRLLTHQKPSNAYALIGHCKMINQSLSYWTSTAMSIKLIVGLRNPGHSYELTRHNAGAWLIETLIKDQHISLQTDKKFQGELALLSTAELNCNILLPLTFMNQSGLSVRAVAQFYRIQPEEMIIAHDDLDLPAGRIKLKTGGGHGGHNGLRDIIAQLGSANFHRLRIGIGHPGHASLVLNYVLGKPSLVEKNSIDQAIDDTMRVMPILLRGQVAHAMTELNQG